MSFMDLIRRGDSSDKAFDDLQSDMAEAFDESMALEDFSASDADKENSKPAADTQLLPAPNGSASAEEAHLPVAADRVAAATEPSSQAAADGELPVAVETVLPVASEKVEPVKRQTAHTQTRLAALESFDKLHRDAQEHLQQIGSKIAEVETSQQLTRRFFNILLTDIHRANDLELANVNLAAEQKKLTEQLADTGKRLKERDSAIDGLRQREASLSQDNEALRAALAEARMELVEAANAAARHEAKLGETLTALSARALEVERSARETELLREKHLGLSVDLDKALKREAEALRRADEIGALQANDAARHQDLLSQLSKSEKEVMRLQLALESVQTRHADMEEAGLIADAEREAEAERKAAEINGLRSEMQSLQARLTAAADGQNEAAAEIARLKAQLNDAAAEKLLADERMAALGEQHDRVKQDLSAANTNISQLVLRQETEQIQLDIQRQECEDLKAEIGSLNARIKELLPFERLYRVTKAREGGDGTAANGSDTPAARNRPPTRRPTPINRGRTAG